MEKSFNVCQRRKVTFDLYPTVFMYVETTLTKEEEKCEQEERWEIFLESLKIGP